MSLRIRTHIDYGTPEPAPVVVMAKRPHGRPKGSVGVRIKDWTKADLASLAKHMADGYTWQRIAEVMQRSVTSCQGKAYRLGLVMKVDGRRRKVARCPSP